MLASKINSVLFVLVETPQLDTSLYMRSLLHGFRCQDLMDSGKPCLRCMEIVLIPQYFSRTFLRGPSSSK